MAKRRSKHSRGGRRSGRRVSGIIPGKDVLMTGAGVAAGAYVATMISSKLPETFNDKAKAAVLALVGLFVAKQNNPLLRGIGLGVFGAGALAGAKSLGVLGNVPLVRLSGLQQFPNNPQIQTVSGFSQYPNMPQKSTVGNLARSRMVSGIF